MVVSSLLLSLLHVSADRPSQSALVVTRKLEHFLQSIAQYPALCFAVNASNLSREDVSIGKRLHNSPVQAYQNADGGES
jgi:hypothetical protein